MVRILASAIAFFAVCSPALAQQLNALSDTPQLTQLVVTVLGTGAAARLAFDAFGRRSVPVANVPTFPRYMTSRMQYRLGTLTFVILACGFFLLLVYEHRQVVKVASLFDVIPQNILQAVDDQSAPYLMIVAAMGAVYLYVLTKEAEWNVLLMMRDMIYRWISIPQLAVQIVAQMRFTLRVPQQAVAAVIASSAGVVEQDFRKDSNTPDRLWAETCYMKWWLTQGHDAGEDATFFTEESFGFDKLLEELRRVSRDVTSWKSGAAGDLVLADLFEKIKDLHNRFSRLVACYLIYRNGSRHELRAEAEKFGVTIKNPVVQHPLRYWVVYVLVLIAAVYVGVNASAIIYDLLTGNGLIVAQDVDRTMAWIMYSLSNYGLAFVVILLLRSISEQTGIAVSQSHLVTYCWTFFVAFIVGPLGLTVAVHTFGQASLAAMPLPDLYYRMLKWGLGPALVSVYISYYLDRQVCEDLPNIDHTAATFGRRLANCLGFSALAMFLFIPLLWSLKAQPGSIWDTDKLRAIAFGTTFCITFGLALAAQFALRQGTSAPQATLSPRTSG
jgi:hypothetical protein